jgi:hypothetical protein
VAILEILKELLQTPAPSTSECKPIPARLSADELEVVLNAAAGFQKLLTIDNVFHFSAPWRTRDHLILCRHALLLCNYKWKKK